MLELLLGFALGAMTFTEQGRRLGDQAAAAATAAAKSMMDRVAAPEPSAGKEDAHD